MIPELDEFMEFLQQKYGSGERPVSSREPITVKIPIFQQGAVKRTPQMPDLGGLSGLAGLMGDGGMGMGMPGMGMAPQAPQAPVDPMMDPMMAGMDPRMV